MRLFLTVLVGATLLAQQAATPPAAPQGAAPKAEEKKAEEKKEAPAAGQAAESTAPAAEQWLSGNVEFGYRWRTDVAGNFNAYRSVVNLGEGPKLLGADFTIQNSSRKVFDRMSVLLHGWGGDPYNTARVDVTREKSYRLTADYRNMAYFNFLPSYADPLLASGVMMNQHSLDTARRYVDLQLDLFPGARVTPYLGYTRNSGSGSGLTNFVADQNEYAVRNFLGDKTDEYRAGVRMEFNRFHMTLEQGGNTFKDDQHVTNAQTTTGNRTVPVFGQQLSLAGLDQAYGIRGDGIYSKMLVTASPANWVNLFGQFLYSKMNTDVRYSDKAIGQFVLLSELQFFTGQRDSFAALAKQPHTSGNGGIELKPFRRLRIVENLTTDRFHNASSVALADFLLTSPTSAANSALVNLGAADRLVYNYNQQQVDAFFDVTSKFTLRGGHRYIWGDAQFTPPELSNVEGLEKAELRRQVGLAGAYFRPTTKLSFTTDFEAANGGRTYFRTSLQDYAKMTARVRYQVHTALQLSANFSLLDNQNPAPTVNYDFRSRANSLSLYWTPAGGKWISVLGEYTRSTLRSDITYLIPQTLTRTRSFYRDNAHSALSVIDFNLPQMNGAKPKISVGGSMYLSSGTRPANYYEPLGRFSIPLHKTVQWFAEWRYYGMAETFYAYEGFRTHLFTTGLRIGK
jgi:hypothetical protein